MKFDLHMHTTRHSPDSAMEPLPLIRQAQKVGLDGIVITEHDWLWTDVELEELRSKAGSLVVLAGIEISAREGHFLVYGVSNPFALYRGIGVALLCREVHHQGGAVVAAHPFRWGQPFAKILEEEHPALDGIELMTSNMDAECRRQAVEVWRANPIAGIGSSDAHDEKTLAACYTNFHVNVHTNRELVDAIRMRRGTAHDNEVDPLI